MTPIFDRPLHRPLDREEERALLERWQKDREPAAARVLIESHLRYVLKLAHRFRHYGIPVEDLVSEGSLGLLEALVRFDPSRDVRFITYAVHWVRAFMLTCVQRHASMVRRGEGTKGSRLFFGVRRARARWTSALGGQLSAGEIDDELARHFNSSAQQLADMSLLLDQGDAWLDAKASPDQGATPLGRLREGGDNQEDRVGDSELATVVRRRLSAVAARLTPKERYVLWRRLYAEEPETLSEIAKQLGVSRERIRQIEEGLKTKLRVELADLDVTQRAA